MHDSGTVSMCNVKMRKDLIKGTNYVTKRITIQTKKPLRRRPDAIDYHYSCVRSKNDCFKYNIEQNLTSVNELTLNIVKFEPKSCHYYLNQADPWFLEKRPLNL